MECTYNIMTGKNERYPQSVQLVLVQNKEEGGNCKICEVERAPKFHDVETHIIMGGIGDVFMERVMTEQLVASKIFLVLKVKYMVPKTRHSVITPE